MLTIKATGLVLFVFFALQCYSRTLNDDKRDLLLGSGKVLVGTVNGDVKTIGVGVGEGGAVDVLLEPYFGELIIKLGKPFVDFPVCPAVHLAVNYGTKDHVNVVSHLLKLGADFNNFSIPTWPPNKYQRGYPPALMFALGMGQIPQNYHPTMLERLSHSFPSIVNTDGVKDWVAITGGPPLLHMALLQKYHEGAFTLLTNFKEDIKSVDQHGLSPLHVAAWFGDIKSMVLLLHYGALANATDNFGRTALHFAVIRCNQLAAELLVDSVEVQNNMNTGAEILRLKGELLLMRDAWGRDAITVAMTSAHLSAVADSLLSTARRLGIRHRWGDAERVAAAAARDDVESEGGGWNGEGLVVVEENRGFDVALVDRVDASQLSAQQFLSDYHTLQRPVLLVDAFLQRSLWLHWRKDAFLARYGALTIAPVTPVVQQKGTKPATFSLEEFVRKFVSQGALRTGTTSQVGSARLDRDSRFYEALRGDLSPRPAFFELCNTKYHRYDGKTRNCTEAGADADLHDCASMQGFPGVDQEPFDVLIAGEGAGASLQSRNASWDLLLFGAAKWFLVPPGAWEAFAKEVNSQYDGSAAQRDLDAVSHSEFISVFLPELRRRKAVLEVTQRAGETLFVPHDWHFVTVFMQNSLLISQQFCTLLHTNVRYQPLGFCLYGGDDPHRGMGWYNVHRKTSNIGIMSHRSKLPSFSSSVN